MLNAGVRFMTLKDEDLEEALRQNLELRRGAYG
jgi:hypothetical protein